MYLSSENKKIIKETSKRLDEFVTNDLKNTFFFKFTVVGVSGKKYKFSVILMSNNYAFHTVPHPFNILQFFATYICHKHALSPKTLILVVSPSRRVVRGTSPIDFATAIRIISSSVK